MSTEVTQYTAPAVPIVGSDFTLSDLALPSLSLAQSTSFVVQAGDAGVGDLVVSAGTHDPEPVVVRKAGDAEGLAVLPLGWLKFKFWSLEENGERAYFEKNYDLDEPLEPGQRIGIAFVVVIPKYSTTSPVEWKCRNSALDCAKRILTNIALSGEPAWRSEFSLSSVRVQGGQGRSWFKPSARRVQVPDPDSLLVAERIAKLLGIPVECES